MSLASCRFRAWAQLLLILLLAFAVGCGSTFFVSGALNPPNTSVAIGTVSFVQFTSILGSDGILVNVTIVTLAVRAVPNTLTFCGNQVPQFAINTAVQVSFIPGTPPCSNLVSVNSGAS